MADTALPSSPSEGKPPHQHVSSLDSIDSDEAYRLRSEALATDASKLETGYFLSARIVGSFIGTGIVVVATYFQFQALAAVLMSSVYPDIGPSANVVLVSTVWTAAQPIALLLFGRLSDRFGRRNFALGSCVLAIVGGIVAATAQSIETLIAAEVIMGIASGVPAAYPLLAGELVSNKYKYVGTALVVLPNVVATGFGPYIGLALVQVANWRWIFYIYIMIMGKLPTIQNLNVVADYSSTWCRLVVLFLPPTFIHPTARQKVQQGCRAQESRLDRSGTPDRWSGFVPSGHLMGRPSSAVVISQNFRFIDIWRGSCCLVHLVRDFSHTPATYRSYALFPRLARVHVPGDHLSDIRCNQHRPICDVATTSYLHLRLDRELMARVRLALYNGRIWSMGWHCGTWPAHVVDWPHQIPDTGVVHLDDSLPRRNG